MICKLYSDENGNGLPLETALTRFAYIPCYDRRLETLKDMAIEEPWGYRCPPPNIIHPHTAVLDRYIKTIFGALAYEYNNVTSCAEADQFICIREEYACFHTGLLTRKYKDIYCFLERNRLSHEYQPYVLKCFGDNTAPLIRKVEVLPQRPFFNRSPADISFDPSLEVRVDVDHILDTQENYMRIPSDLRDFPNLPLLLQAAVDLALREAKQTPRMVVPQLYHGHRIQFLLPICLYEPRVTDLVMTLEAMNGYYLAATCITPVMAYGNARTWGRPTEPWLVSAVR